MDPKIKCLKCESYIHDTDHCLYWKEKRFCFTDKKWKEKCGCAHCEKEICQYCNNWTLYCFCYNERCSICNEHLRNFKRHVICVWDHTKSPCQFCNLPIKKNLEVCTNNHNAEYPLCKVCNLPERYSGHHNHDDNLCKKCGSLLNYGRCIYNCVNGGNRCIHCYWEGVVNNVCSYCKKDQNGFLTKAAIK